jgi:hypothetical protein
MAENNGQSEAPLSGTIEIQRRTSERSMFWKKVYRKTASPWLLFCFLTIGWVPLFIVDWLSGIYPHPYGNYDCWAGWGIAWGIGITGPSTLAAGAWLIIRGGLFVVRTVIREFRGS